MATWSSRTAAGTPSGSTRGSSGGGWARGASRPFPYASHYGPQGLAIGDLTGDGRPDIAIADYNHGLIVLANAGPVPTPTPTPTPAHAAPTPTAGTDPGADADAGPDAGPDARRPTPSPSRLAVGPAVARGDPSRPSLASR